jgi:hypothetical protein
MLKYHPYKSKKFHVTTNNDKKVYFEQKCEKINFNGIYDASVSTIKEGALGSCVAGSGCRLGRSTDAGCGSPPRLRQARLGPAWRAGLRSWWHRRAGLGGRGAWRGWALAGCGELGRGEGRGDGYAPPVRMRSYPRARPLDTRHAAPV